MLLLCCKCFAPVMDIGREEPFCTTCMYFTKRDTKPFPTFAKPETESPDHKPIWERWEPPDEEEV